MREIVNKNSKIASKYVRAYIEVIKEIEDRMVSRSLVVDNGETQLYLFVKKAVRNAYYDIEEINRAIEIIMKKKENRKYLDVGYIPKVRYEDGMLLFEVPYVNLRGAQGRLQVELLKAYMSECGIGNMTI